MAINKVQESDCNNVNQSDWYALHSHPNKESYLYAELTSRGIQAYYPCLHVKPVNPRSHTIRPYFPGYLFVYIDNARIWESEFKWMPHAYGLVCFGDTPASVPEALINRIRQQLDQAASQKNNCNFQKGENVQLRGEIFNGCEAIFDTSIEGTERVRVLLKILNNNQIPLELNLNQIEEKKKSLAG
jgi:transcription antitermination factor NusG